MYPDTYRIPIKMTYGQGLYREHYLIALYDYDDDNEFEAVFTNIDEMALDIYGYITPKMYQRMCHYFYDNRTAIVYHGKKCVPHFIEAFDDEKGESVLHFAKTWKNVFPADTHTLFIDGDIKTETILTDEAFKDRIVRKIRARKGWLRIWLRKPKI